jgi:predicted nucleotidyltransferase
LPVLDRAQLEQILADIVARLRAALSPVAIYCFGSYAYGVPASHSDIDLLVVVAESRVSPYQRDAQAYRALRGVPVPADVLVYTRPEFEQRAALPISLERTVKSRGRLLYAA